MKQTAPFLALGADKITTFGYLSSIVSLFVIIGITVARLQFIGIALFLVLPFIIFLSLLSQSPAR